MKIRKIKKTDISECTKILEKAYGHHPYNEVFKGVSARLYIEGKYKNCKKHSFIAVDEKNKLIAFIFLNISAWSEGLQVVLEEIVVSPKLQGSGIGKELMQHAHDYLYSLGIKSVMLWAKNDVRLIEFYKKQGYFVADDYVVMFKNI